MNHELTVFTDGGSRGNPGQAAYGFVIYDSGKKELIKIGKRLGIQTNNYAEYMAVVESLRWIAGNISPSPTHIHMFLDSQLIEKQMKGLYKIKQETLRSLFFTAQEIMSSLGSRIIFTHVPRAQNKVADSMVNLALDHKV